MYALGWGCRNPVHLLLGYGVFIPASLAGAEHACGLGHLGGFCGSWMLLLPDAVLFNVCKTSMTLWNAFRYSPAPHVGSQ
jgi:hypothetical protein